MPYRNSYVSAPAGSGKTTTIVRRYLHELRLGKSADEIVAITFTRLAAAELVNRVASVLRARLEVPIPANIQMMYRDIFAGDVALGLPPLTIEHAGSALQRLPFAPVVTVDSFVQSLLQEYLLDAAYKLPNGQTCHIDGPITVTESADEVFQSAARESMTADEANANLLLLHESLGEAVSVVAKLAAFDGTGMLLDADNPVGWRVLAQNVAPDHVAPDHVAPQVREFINRAGVDNLNNKLAINNTWTLQAQTTVDELRTAAWKLSRAARATALRELAESACGTHAELLRAATYLCQRAANNETTCAAGLCNRFRALLVDEVQDTNPDQLAFYRAFAAMNNSEFSMLYVGDGRQSIYRFRDADHHGWKNFYTAAPEDNRAELTINYRSSKKLIEFQKVVIGAIRGARPHACDPIALVQPRDGAAEGDLDADEGLEKPVLVAAVYDSTAGEGAKVAQAAIALFARRLGARWVTLEHAEVTPKMKNSAEITDTAVVLTPSWHKAAEAVVELKLHGIKAQLSGASQILKTRVALDVLVLLQALLDPTDEIAWLGVLKHPSVGVSDHAMARVRPFGRLLFDDALERIDAEILATITEPDLVRLRVALPIIRAARRKLGTVPTAEVLDEAIGALRWREFLQAGPEGIESVADLDLVFEIVAGCEEERVDPQAVRELLESDHEKGDLPSRRFAVGDCCVEVTTIFQAKGLEFDHVCLMRLDPPPGGGGGERTPIVEALSVCGNRVLATNIDPAGGVTSDRDPASKVFADLNNKEARFENDRKVYVAITRAKQSLTFGIKVPKSSKESPKDRGKASVERYLSATLGLIDDPLIPLNEDFAHLYHLYPLGDEQHPFLNRPPMNANPRARARGATLAEVPAHPNQLIQIISPSKYKGDAPCAVERNTHFIANAQIFNGGEAPQELPGLGNGFDVRVRGDVVHGWFERWGFAGDPFEATAQDYLADRWPTLATQPGLAAALCALGQSVLAIPAFEALVHESGATLHFEHSVVATVGNDLLVGRADLVVLHANGDLSVVDFKGGWGAPAQAAIGDLPDINKYALQLGAYFCALTAANRHVRSVSLLYVGIPLFVKCD